MAPHSSLIALLYRKECWQLWVLSCLGSALVPCSSYTRSPPAAFFWHTMCSCARCILGLHLETLLLPAQTLTGLQIDSRVHLQW